MAGIRFLPHGTTLSVNSQDVGGVVTITLPDQTRGEVEITDNDSGGTREFLPGLRDNGSLSVECRYIPGDTGQEEVRSNFATASLATSVVPVLITMPSGATDSSDVATFSFDAFVTALGGELPQADDEAGSFTFTMKVDGDVTEALA